MNESCLEQAANQSHQTSDEQAASSDGVRLACGAGEGHHAGAAWESRHRREHTARGRRGRVGCGVVGHVGTVGGRSAGGRRG